MSAADNPELAGVFKRPFAEQLAFWRQKLGNRVPTARWDDLWKSQHDRAFMVAGAMKADLLADLAAAVDRAINEGVGIGQFRKDFDAIVAKHGWSYTGERNWRTRVIYRTNAASSYAAGRLAQLRAGGFGLWMYKHGGSLDPRPQHLAWDGLVLPPDHPFWQTHAPPNGWGCSCRIVGVRSKDVARRLGGDPDKALPDGWDAIDPRTGEPRGIDRGWGYQPGAMWEPFDRHATTPECLFADVRATNSERNCIRALPGQPDFVVAGRPRIRDVEAAQRLPVPPMIGRASDRDMALSALAQALGVSAESPRRWVDTPIPGPALSRILIDHGYLAHMVTKDSNARERYANFILPTLTAPYEAWVTRYDDGSIRPRLIGLFTGARQIAVIIRVNTDSSLFWNFMNADDRRLDDFRVGTLVYGR